MDTILRQVPTVSLEYDGVAKLCEELVSENRRMSQAYRELLSENKRISEAYGELASRKRKAIVEALENSSKEFLIYDP